MSARRYETPTVTLLGVLSSPLEPNRFAEAFAFNCTACERPGALACGSVSPVTKDVRAVRELAITAGWRLSGSDDPSLFNGEALCPKHRACSISDVLKRHGGE